ncbi:MAG: acyltransferase [Candidatus Aminicenantes bacterium]|nr:acyltransferase [Candidatus Aminicenantes bacterium]
MKNSHEGGSVQKALLGENKSAFSKYRELFVGNKGFLYLLKYELIILFFSGVPGSLGFFLRKIFFPMLFKAVGKGVVFGRNMTIRHPHKIVIGEQTFFDDYVVLDAKGSENEGIIIGKNVIIGRSTILSCKKGSIFLDDFCNISANCFLLSETEIRLGKYCFMAGHCYLVAGGNHSFDKTDVPIMFQPSQDMGGITIADDVWLGASVTVLDGVSMGKGCIVGAGAVVKDSLQEYNIAVGVPARKIKSRLS